MATLSYDADDAFCDPVEEFAEPYEPCWVALVTHELFGHEILPISVSDPYCPISLYAILTWLSAIVL